uniref:Uncharacterized protein n=1 Tax=Callorhinchus milii TaxID=7868 RepID=A0A4W3GIB3_CALMI
MTGSSPVSLSPACCSPASSEGLSPSHCDGAGHERGDSPGRLCSPGPRPFSLQPGADHKLSNQGLAWDRTHAEIAEQAKQVRAGRGAGRRFDGSNAGQGLLRSLHSTACPVKRFETSRRRDRAPGH